MLAILAVYRSVLIFVTDRHLFWQNRFYLSRRLGSGEYYPLGAICCSYWCCYAANAAFAGHTYLIASLRPAVGGRNRVLCTPRR